MDPTSLASDQMSLALHYAHLKLIKKSGEHMMNEGKKMHCQTWISRVQIFLHVIYLKKYMVMQDKNVLKNMEFILGPCRLNLVLCT